MMTSHLLLLLLTVLSVCRASNPPQMCLKMSPCGADCFTTCDNPCQCDLTRRGQLSFPSYGGMCKDTGFCELPPPTVQQCVEGSGDSVSQCPSMVSEEEAVNRFTEFDYRVDVRSDEEWEEGHSNMSLHTPGLAVNPAVNYQHLWDQLAGAKEDSKILVYCKGGTRALSAALKLLRYGFSNVHSLHSGGFPGLAGRIAAHSQQLTSDSQPSKAACYIAGGRNSLCPRPLPISHIHSRRAFNNRAENIQLVDVQTSKAESGVLNRAVRVPNKKRRIKKFLKTLRKQQTLVLYSEEGDAAFSAAKDFIKLGWSGEIYFVDNGGFEELRQMGF